MGTARSCDHLRREHELIGRVAAGVAVLGQRQRSGGAVPPLPFAGAVDFFTGFVARCHDVKEDEALFPAVATHGAVTSALMQALRKDHEEGHRLLGALRPLLSRKPLGSEAWGLLDAYLALLRRHIVSEDGDLLPVVERLLTPEDDAAIERAFVQIEERALGRAGREALVALAGAVTHASDALAAADALRDPHLLARHIMRPKPGTVGPDDSLARAAEVMESFQTRELPVVVARTVVGILTRTDMEPHRGHYEWTAVRAAMTAKPECVAPEAPVAAVARLLRRRGINAVPVTVAGELVGMIARADVLRVLMDDGETPGLDA